MKQVESTIGIASVRVWHCNDAKAARGSKLDRHQHIGQGSIGLEPFRCLLNDPQLLIQIDREKAKAMRSGAS